MSAPCDVDKQREVVFHPLPPGQTERALELLAALPGIKVEKLGPQTLEIRYCVLEYSLEDLENRLSLAGCHLENNLMMRIKRALVYYVEHVQRENLHKPATQTKKYQPHMEAWDKQPHGDHDETPSEWRRYK